MAKKYYPNIILEVLELEPFTWYRVIAQYFKGNTDEEFDPDHIEQGLVYYAGKTQNSYVNRYEYITIPEFTSKELSPGHTRFSNYEKVP